MAFNFIGRGDQLPGKQYQPSTTHWKNKLSVKTRIDLTTSVVIGNDRTDQRNYSYYIIENTVFSVADIKLFLAFGITFLHCVSHEFVVWFIL